MKAAAPSIEGFEALKSQLQSSILQFSELFEYKSKYEALLEDFKILSEKFKKLAEEETEANKEVINLRHETEELSTELFSEANKMVSTERQINYQINEEVKKLKSVFNEQKHIMDLNQNQLTFLRDTIQGLETEIIYFKNKPVGKESRELLNELGTNSKIEQQNDLLNKQQLFNILYTPMIQATRKDLKFESSFLEYLTQGYENLQDFYYLRD